MLCGVLFLAVLSCKASDRTVSSVLYCVPATNCGQEQRHCYSCTCMVCYEMLTLKVLVATIDAQWEEMGDVGSARYEPALLPPCPTTRILNYSK